MKKTILFLTFFISCLCAGEESSRERCALLSSIPKTSLRELLLFATLHEHTPEGHEATCQAWHILSPSKPAPPLFEKNVYVYTSFLEPSLFSSSTHLNIPPEILTCIPSENLPHKKKAGHFSSSIDEIERLDAAEIDLAHALVLLENQKKASPTEAALDMLALTILSRIGKEASPGEKIAAINTLLFDELEFRYPPLSEAAENAKEFSELSSVLFSRRGICLGSSILYLCLAERLDLPLKIFTPPGHIFVGYTDGSTLRIIETTARGVEVPVSEYLGITLKSLPERSIKEVIGMVAFNKAGDFLKEKKWNEALSLYSFASRFERDEELISMMSLCELLLKNKKKSKALAEEAMKTLSPHRLEHDLLLIDLSEGALSPEAAEVIVETSSQEKDKIPQNIKKLEQAIGSNPKSLTLPLHLASMWTMYGKSKEACYYLETIKHKAPCSVHFFLAELFASRLDMTHAWEEAEIALQLAKLQGTIPKPLQHFMLELQLQSPNLS
jgi:regulator of sirC expression with transglutaminase-like and TPR domain